MSPPHRRAGAEFRPLSPSTLHRYVNNRVDSMLGLLKLVGIEHMSSAMRDEILDIHTIVLDHICHDPELYVDSAREVLRLRDAMIPAKT